ncbi:MAG: hypothetical protein MSC30_04810 [Gaiellaceae bacterium MAG52_C11]|nr:hypothetical protein [Candidatus Gaiellasilicea maunaloa]
MAEQKCPTCGIGLPEELGQHSIAPQSNLVRCPNCGETVNLEKPADDGEVADEAASGDVPRSTETVGGEAGAPNEFSGETTLEGLKEELEEKPGGGEAA